MKVGDIVSHTEKICVADCENLSGTCRWVGVIGKVANIRDNIEGPKSVLVKMITTNKIWKQGSHVSWSETQLEVIEEAKESSIAPIPGIISCTELMKSILK